MNFCHLKASFAARNELPCDFLDAANKFNAFYVMRLRWLTVDRYSRSQQMQAPNQPQQSLMFQQYRAPIPPPPPPLIDHRSQVDQSADPHSASNSPGPIVSTMRFDQSSISKDDSHSKNEYDLQMERRRKAQSFLAQIMAEKRRQKDKEDGENAQKTGDRTTDE